MKILKFNNKPNYRSNILLYHDDLLLWKDSEAYDRRWQNRCTDCPAPCCYFEMFGYYYDYKEYENGDMKSSMQEFWTNKFVIISVRYEQPAEQIEMGFKIQIAPELDKIQICPLNVHGKCLIYEDRPLMCKNWKCQMKLGSNLVE